MKALVSLPCDRAHDTIGISYKESETYRSQDANLIYSEDTDVRHNASYFPLPTPSGSTGDPGRIQLLPPDSGSTGPPVLGPTAAARLSRFSTADLDAESPHATSTQQGFSRFSSDRSR